MASSSSMNILLWNGLGHLKDSVLSRQNQSVYAKLPLERFSSQIRTVSLWPGRFEDEIQCRLGVEVWTEPYDALSYCWGKKHPMQKIKVNGKSFMVSEALYMALKYLRRSDGYMKLWIDAISINQWDQVERSWQVPRMARIYSHAEQVIVWLGEPNDALKLGVTLIDQLSLAEDESQFRHTWKRSKHQVGSLEMLWQLPWWSRTWVIQEVVSAKSARICIGHEVREWDDFGRAILLMGVHIEGQYQSSEFKTVHQFVEFVKRVQNSESRLVQQSLLELAQYFRGRQATDPRDKIYGLMGMSGEAFKNGFLADYSISVSQCYAAFVKQNIERSKDLYVFGLGEYRSSTNFDLPSWCTDWTVNTIQPLPLWQRVNTDDRSRSRGFMASGSTIAQVLSPDPRTLKVRGLVVDRVAAVGKPTTAELTWHMVAPLEALAPKIDAEVFVRVISAGSLVLEEYSYYQEIIDAFRAGKLRSELGTNISDACAHRSFVLTQRRRLGLVPKATNEGDLVCILPGAAVPFVIRDTGGFYSLIGQAYIDGIMQYEGDLDSDIRTGKVVLHDFLFK